LSFYLTWKKNIDCVEFTEGRLTCIGMLCLFTHQPHSFMCRWRTCWRH
jgi:hypothetical protein